MHFRVHGPSIPKCALKLWHRIFRLGKICFTCTLGLLGNRNFKEPRIVWAWSMRCFSYQRRAQPLRHPHSHPPIAILVLFARKTRPTLLGARGEREGGREGGIHSEKERASPRGHDRPRLQNTAEVLKGKVDGDDDDQVSETFFLGRTENCRVN